MMAELRRGSPDAGLVERVWRAQRRQPVLRARADPAAAGARAPASRSAAARGGRGDRTAPAGEAARRTACGCSSGRRSPAARSTLELLAACTETDVPSSPTSWPPRPRPAWWCGARPPAVRPRPLPRGAPRRHGRGRARPAPTCVVGPPPAGTGAARAPRPGWPRTWPPRARMPGRRRWPPRCWRPTRPPRRLGHDDACHHLERALAMLGDDAPSGAGAPAGPGRGPGPRRAARPRPARASTSWPRLAARRRRRAAPGARRPGLQLLGARSGAQVAEVIDAARGRRTAARATRRAPRRCGRRCWPRSPARTGTARQPGVDLVAARRAGGGAGPGRRGPGSARDVRCWPCTTRSGRPGSAEARLHVVTDMLAAASAAGDPDLVAQARQLRAAALLELGDPAGRDELLAYVGLAERPRSRPRAVGGADPAGDVRPARRARSTTPSASARRRWRWDWRSPSPTRWAASAPTAGRWPLSESREPELPIDPADPMWPMFPLIRAWSHAARGDEAEARRVLGDFSVLDITPTHDLERYAVAAVVFAVAGTDEQRAWAYDRLLPARRPARRRGRLRGLPRGGRPPPRRAGRLARRPRAAERHYRDALGCTSGWVRRAGSGVTERALAELAGTRPRRNDFRARRRPLGARRTPAGAVTLPDAKGLHDLHALLGAAGREVHVLDLLGPEVAATVGRTGADPVLDDEAKARVPAPARPARRGARERRAGRGRGSRRGVGVRAHRPGARARRGHRAGRPGPPPRRRERAGPQDGRRPGPGQPGQDRPGAPRARRPPARLAADGHVLRLPADRPGRWRLT